MITRRSFNTLFRNLLISVGIVTCLCYPAGAQTAAPDVEKEHNQVSSSAPDVNSRDDFFQTLYRNFYDTYRLGPGDELAVRVMGQPDYSLPRVKISPVGRLYHPLVGEVEVVGMTVAQLQKKLADDFSEYIKDPKVSVSLEEAQSAKVGVLGEVKLPGIVVITRPMTVLETIAASGGFTETAKRSDVTVLRQLGDGRVQKLKVDVKRVLDGKADPEGNLMMRAGDTIVVGSNTRKKVASVMSLMGFAQFLTFVALGRG